MAETSRFWDGTTTGDATQAPYDAGTEFAQVMTLVAGALATTNLGGVSGSGNALAVSGTATPAVVASGDALVYGTYYNNSASVNVTVPTPSGATRIDYIVLRKSWAAQTVVITRIAGVEGGSAPALVQSVGTTWDIPLATVSITTGGVMTVTDAREFMAAGILPFSVVATAAAPSIKTPMVEFTGTTGMTNITIPSYLYGRVVMFTFRSAGVTITHGSNWSLLGAKLFTSVAGGAIMGYVTSAGVFTEIERSPGQGLLIKVWSSTTALSTTTNSSSGSYSALGTGILTPTLLSTDRVRLIYTGDKFEINRTVQNVTARLVADRGGTKLSVVYLTDCDVNNIDNGIGASGVFEEVPGAGAFTYTPQLLFTGAAGNAVYTAVSASVFIVEVWR